ncbi:MAG: FGGY family carbohydrate kinase [Polyangiaceae bacterium]
MTEPVVLGLDASTTAVKAIAIAPNGEVLAEGRATYPLSNPEPDGWEQSAADWTRAALEALSGCVRRLATEHRSRVRALAIAHQRETFVVTDRRGEPLAPAIVWMDARSKPEVRRASSELDPARILALSGKVPCTTPSLYKLRMLLERTRPDLGARADLAVFDVHGFLVRALTGASATSTASADPLGLVDMERRAWSTELCELARARVAFMPELFEPGQPIAELSPEVLAAIGLDVPIMVVAGAGDGQAAAVGAGVVEEGSAYVNFGTAIVGGAPSSLYRYSRAFRTLFSGAGTGYLVETDLKGGTLTLDWLADRVLANQSTLEGGAARAAILADLEARAGALPPGALGLLTLPYWAGVMSPYWDDDAGGAFIGLRADHGPEHLYRSICEGLCLEQRLAFEHVERAGVAISDLVATGGAASRASFLALAATVMGRPIRRSAVSETTALGAAMLALGWVTGEAPATVSRRLARAEAPTLPGPERAFYEALYSDVYRDLYTGLERALSRLAALRAG